MAPVSMILSDFLARFQGHDIIQRQITSMSNKSKMVQDRTIYNGGPIDSHTRRPAMLGLMGFSGSLPLYVVHRCYIFVC